MRWTPSGLQNSSSLSLALRAGRPPNRSANYTAVNLGFLLTVIDVWTQPTSKRRSCTNCLPRGDRAVIEVAVRPIPKRFSEVVDKLPPGSWVGLTPDRKLVAGIVPEPANRKSITRFATEQAPAQLLREGKAVYEVTLDLIVQESGVDELPT